MKKLQNNTAGFTAIELLVFILVLVIVAVVGISNIRALRAENRDAARKTDINATYYQLESFYEKNGYYPQKLTVSTLQGIDPESLKDTRGKSYNEPSSQYTYKTIGCTDQKCKSYTLTADLEKEAPFTKKSLNG